MQPRAWPLGMSRGQRTSQPARCGSSQQFVFCAIPLCRLPRRWLSFFAPSPCASCLPRRWPGLHLQQNDAALTGRAKKQPSSCLSHQNRPHASFSAPVYPFACKSGKSAPTNKSGSVHPGHPFAFVYSFCMACVACSSEAPAGRAQLLVVWNLASLACSNLLLYRASLACSSLLLLPCFTIFQPAYHAAQVHLLGVHGRRWLAALEASSVRRLRLLRARSAGSAQDPHTVC